MFVDFWFGIGLLISLVGPMMLAFGVMMGCGRSLSLAVVYIASGAAAMASESNGIASAIAFVPTAHTALLLRSPL